MAMNKRPEQGKQVYAQMTRSASAPMSDAYREKLLRLRRQENMKSLLVRKFYDRYGVNKNKDNCGGCSPKEIAKEVNNFLQSAVTERNLNRLERKIQKRVMADKYADDQSVVSKYSMSPIGLKVLKKPDPETPLLRAESAPSVGFVEQDHDQPCEKGYNALYGDHTLAESKPIIANNMAKTHYTGFSCSSVQVPSEASSAVATPCGYKTFGEQRRGQSFSWGALDYHAAWKLERDIKMRKIKTAENRDKLRSELDQQVVDSRKRKQQERENEYSFFQKQMDDLRKARQMQEEKNRNHKTALMNESNGFLEMARENREREEENRRKKIEEEDVMVEKCRLEQEAIREKKHQKKMVAMGEMQAFLAADNDEIERRIEKQRAVDLEERLRIEQVKENLLAQEKARGEAFSKRMERQLKIAGGGMAAANYAFNEEKKRIAELRKAQEIEEIARRFDEKANLKKQDSQKVKKDTQIFQLQQREDRKKLQQDEKDRRTALQNSYTEDAEKYFTEQREKGLGIKFRNIDYQRILREQIATKYRDMKDETNMTAIELDLNRALVEEVESEGFS